MSVVKAAAPTPAVSKNAVKKPIELPNFQNPFFIKLEQDPYFRTGYLFQTSGEFSAAVACYAKSIQVNPSAEAYTFLSTVLSHIGEMDVAIAQARRAVDLNPEFGFAWNHLGVLLLEKHQYDEAIDCFKKTIAAKICGGEGLLISQGHLNIARANLFKGMLRTAVTEIEQALVFDPKNEQALMFRDSLSRSLN